MCVGGVKREASETENRGGMRLSDGVRQKQVKDAEEGNCGKSVRRIGMVMRRVYQLFRCCLLIKHHQTPNLLTINTLLHYHVFSPPSFPSSLFLFLFPSGSLSLSFSAFLPSPFCCSFSLSNTPNAGQINYLMHLSLSARAQSNLPPFPFTDTFSHKKQGLTQEKDIFSQSFWYKERASTFLFFPFLLFSCPSKSDISRAY